MSPGTGTTMGLLGGDFSLYMSRWTSTGSQWLCGHGGPGGRVPRLQAGRPSQPRFNFLCLGVYFIFRKAFYPRWSEKHLPPEPGPHPNPIQSLVLTCDFERVVDTFFKGLCSMVGTLVRHVDWFNSRLTLTYRRTR